jgi:periplasmic copper chaperone A
MQTSNSALTVGIRKRFFTLILAAILLTACGAGSAESGIEAHQAKVEAAAQGKDSPFYLALHNHGSETDQLTGVSTDAAEATQLQNGAGAVDAIPVYANTEFVFIPDGYHVMLVGLKQELHVGDEIEVVLHFRDHEDITLTVPVGEASGHEHDH